MIRAAALLLLTGCATHAPIIPQQAQPQVKKIDLEAVKALLQPCPIDVPTKYTVAEATRVANARRESLIRCNQDKAEALKRLQAVQ